VANHGSHEIDLSSLEAGRAIGCATGQDNIVSFKSWATAMLRNGGLQLAMIVQHIARNRYPRKMLPRHDRTLGQLSDLVICFKNLGPAGWLGKLEFACLGKFTLRATIDAHGKRVKLISIRDYLFGRSLDHGIVQLPKRYCMQQEDEQAASTYRKGSSDKTALAASGNCACDSARHEVHATRLAVWGMQLH